MFHNLYPLPSIGYMNLGQALFFHHIVNDEEIDICSHIFHILSKIAEKTTSRNYLPFNCLVSKILKLKGILPLEDERPYPRPIQSTSALSMLALVTPGRELSKRVMLPMLVLALALILMIRS